MKNIEYVNYEIGSINKFETDSVYGLKLSIIQFESLYF